MINFIDSHVHLDSKDYEPDLSEVINRALSSGVTQLITIGASDGVDSASRAVKISNQYDFIKCSVGIHPHCAGKDYKFYEIRKLSSHQNVVAIGETGLDFFRDWAPIKAQEESFREHIRLAREVKKPLIIHSREAGVRCLEILKEENAAEIGGVFHCFAEDSKFSDEIWKLGFYVSFPGIITFKKAISAKEAAKEIPLSRILLETDGPFLAPEPHRGKRCESAYIPIIAKALADLKGISVEEVAKVTTENAKKVFNL